MLLWSCYQDPILTSMLGPPQSRELDTNITISTFWFFRASSDPQDKGTPESLLHSAACPPRLLLPALGKGGCSRSSLWRHLLTPPQDAFRKDTSWALGHATFQQNLKEAFNGTFQKHVAWPRSKAHVRPLASPILGPHTDAPHLSHPKAGPTAPAMP